MGDAGAAVGARIVTSANNDGRPLPEPPSCAGVLRGRSQPRTVAPGPRLAWVLAGGELGIRVEVASSRVLRRLWLRVEAGHRAASVLIPAWAEGASPQDTWFTPSSGTYGAAQPMETLDSMGVAVDL